MAKTFEHADPLLSAAESAEVLGIAVPTLHKWVGKGIIRRPVKLGKLARWPRSELLEFLENAKANRAA